MAKITHRDYAAPSYRYSRKPRMWEEKGRYIIAGFSNEEDAIKILQTIAEIRNTYGLVSVADVYDVAGLDGAKFTDDRLGWTGHALSDQHLCALFDGVTGWYIQFPEIDWREWTDAKTAQPHQHNITITISTENVEDPYNIMAAAFEYASTVKDRDVYISII